MSCIYRHNNGCYLTKDCSKCNIRHYQNMLIINIFPEQFVELYRGNTFIQKLNRLQYLDVRNQIVKYKLERFRFRYEDVEWTLNLENGDETDFQ